MAITFGDAGAPSQITSNLDALFATSLANYQKTLVDNIGAANAFLFKIIQSGMYRGVNGGEYIHMPLMYELAPMDSYDGYDELSSLPTDGITAAIFEWRQLATPIAYSNKEVIQNANKIVDLVNAKIRQAEMGIQESFATHLLQGSGDAALATPKVSSVNGSSSIEPLAKLIAYDPTASATIGNINQSTSTWWQNKTKASAATTYSAFLLELDNIYNSCALGTGGPPDLITMDQTSYELLVHAIYLKYRQTGSDNNFPFENTRFKRATVVMDEKVPDVYTGVTSVATYGTAYLTNSKFFQMKHINGRDFDMLKDENGKTFAKPIKGDSRLGHIAWMGNCCVDNRRKHGVFGKIARTLTAS